MQPFSSPQTTNTLSPPNHTGDTPLVLRPLPPISSPLSPISPLSPSSSTPADPQGSTWVAGRETAEYRPSQDGRSGQWEEKVRIELEGWRGGHGTPRSDYPQSAVPSSRYFGTSITGIIGRDLPKEVVRIERDWSGGEVCQFYSNYPMELEGRVTPLAFQSFINTINAHLVSAYSLKQAIIDNLIAITTWWTSLIWRKSHFECELRKAEEEISIANREIFNPAGLNVLSPRDVGLQFLEIEYY